MHSILFKSPELGPNTILLGEIMAALLKQMLWSQTTPFQSTYSLLLHLNPIVLHVQF